MDRRKFFGLSAAAGGLLAAKPASAQPSGPAYAGSPKMDVQAPLTQQQKMAACSKQNKGKKGDDYKAAQKSCLAA